MAPFANDSSAANKQIDGAVVYPPPGRRAGILFIKVAHSLIYLFMSACLGYLYYAALTATYDWRLVVAVGMVGLEAALLFLSGMRCPLSNYARYLGDETGNDLLGDYLPQWAVRRTVPICTFVFVSGLVLLVVSYLLRF